jgi:hypothetical protein
MNRAHHSLAILAFSLAAAHTARAQSAESEPARPQASSNPNRCHRLHSHTLSPT